MTVQVLNGTTVSDVHLHDDLGRWVGTIAAPLNADPVGAGRETVYLVRAALPRDARLRAAPRAAVAT